METTSFIQVKEKKRENLKSAKKNEQYDLIVTEVKLISMPYFWNLIPLTNLNTN